MHPTSLEASEVTTSSVRLSWTKYPSQAYAIQYRRKYWPGALFATSDVGSDNRIRVGGLASNTVYEFRVKTYNLDFDSEVSQTVDVTTGDYGQSYHSDNQSINLLSKRTNQPLTLICMKYMSQFNIHMSRYKTYHTIYMQEPTK